MEDTKEFAQDSNIFASEMGENLISALPRIRASLD